MHLHGKWPKLYSLDELYIAPGNSGTRKHGKNVAIDPNNFSAVKKDFVLENNIELVVVGPGRTSCKWYCRLL